MALRNAAGGRKENVSILTSQMSDLSIQNGRKKKDSSSVEGGHKTNDPSTHSSQNKEGFRPSTQGQQVIHIL